jgi:hypothetical protein
MRRTAISILLSWCIAFAGFVPPAGAQVKRTYTLAVLDLTANGISESEARALSDFLRGSITEAVASERYRKSPKVVYARTIERSQMDKIFDQFNIQNTGCVSDSCAVEFGKMLGVERIVIGSVGLVGQTYTVQSRIVDVESSEIVASSTYTFRGERDALIEKGVPRIVSELLYGKREAPGRKKYYIIAGIILIGGAVAGALMGGSKGGDSGSVGVSVEFPE